MGKMTKWKCSKYGCMMSPCLFETRNEKMTPCLCPLSSCKAPEWAKQEEPATTATATATLPDWVEIGGYVYCPRNGYGKIISGSIKSCYIEFNDGAGDFTAESISQLFLQARIRPYNAKEMRGLVGKVIENNNKVDCLLVTAYNSGKELDDVASVMTLGEWVTAEELLKYGYTIDGSPCGVLEHLSDSGEWVE